MALKADRQIIEDDITYACTGIAVRGEICVLVTSGSGVAIGDSAGQCEVSSTASGKKVVGLILNDMVLIDETRYHRNYLKDEMKVGEKCRLLKKGWVITNRITGTPAVGGIAYLTTGGVLTPTLDTNGGLVATPKVGQFASIKDEDGYVKVELNLPVV